MTVYFFPITIGVCAIALLMLWARSIGYNAGRRHSIEKIRKLEKEHSSIQSELNKRWSKLHNKALHERDFAVEQVNAAIDILSEECPPYDPVERIDSLTRRDILADQFHNELKKGIAKLNNVKVH